MIDKKQIIRFLDESNKQKRRYKELFLHSTDLNSRNIYRDLYLRSLYIYSARYQMLLCFGYDVLFDEDNNIIGIKSL